MLNIQKRKVKSEFCFCSSIPANGLAAVYKYPEEKMELTAAYIKAGLEQNERCIWLVPDFQSAEKAKNLLSNSDLDIENRIEKSRLKIIPLKEKDDPSIKQTETSRIYFDWKAGNPQKEIIKFIHAGNWRYLRINLEVGAFGKSITTSLKELRCVLAENMPEKKIRPLFMIKEEDLSAEEVFNLIEAGEKLVIKREEKWKFLKIKQESPNKKFKTLIENSGDSILIHDMNGRVLEANHVACETFGYTRSKMIGKHIKDLRTSIHLIEFGQQIEKLKQTGYFTFEMDSLRRDGTVIPQEVNNRLIEYDGETAVLSIGRDISKRRQTEKALRDSERKYRMLFEEFPGGIAQFDKYGTIIVCNENFVNFTGSGENEKLIFNLLNPPEEKKQEEKGFTCLPEVPIHCDIKYISSLEEEIIPGEITYKPLISENSRFNGGIILVEDLTEVKRLEAVRLQQTETLRKLVGSIPVPAFCKDRNGVYIACNKGFENLLRVQKQDIIGKHIYDFIPHKIAENYHAMDIGLVKHKRNHVYETSLKFPDGSVHQ